jgi:hypothetical protein
MAQNLILGLVHDFNYFRIERFFKSLYKTPFKGHVCIFLGPGADEKTRETLTGLGVETIRYTTTFPYIDSPHPANFKSLPDNIAIYNFRHFLYYDYLLKNGAKFSNVLLTDVKDVVFQKDPFDFAIEDKLYVALEKQTIEDCAWTGKWIVEGYDHETLQAIQHNLASCAGTTMGPTKLMEQYLFKMLTQIKLLKDAHASADQAPHNVLLYNHELDPVVKLLTDSDIIMTVGSLHDYPFAYDKEGFLLSGNGKRVNIIHQADRRVELQKQLDKFIFKKPFPLSLLKIIADKFPAIGNTLRSLRN